MTLTTQRTQIKEPARASNPWAGSALFTSAHVGMSHRHGNVEHLFDFGGQNRHTNYDEVGQNRELETGFSSNVNDYNDFTGLAITNSNYIPLDNFYQVLHTLSNLFNREGPRTAQVEFEGAPSTLTNKSEKCGSIVPTGGSNVLQ